MSNHQADEYFEEVNQLADSLGELIDEGELKTREEVARHLHEAVEQLSYVHNPRLSLVCLQSSHYPTIGFFDRLVVDEEAYARRLRGEDAVDWDGGRAAFPFAQFATAAMVADVREELATRPAYCQLRGDHDPEGET